MGLWFGLWFPVQPSSASDWKAALSPGPLNAEHAELEADCESCHEDFRGTPNDRCLACHTPIQELMDARTGFHGTLSETSCGDCHRDHRGRDSPLTKPAASESFDHGRTRFALGGAHATPACVACHSYPLEVLSLESTRACAGCHEDPHAEEFPGGFGADCLACHSDVAFDPVKKTREDHSLLMTGGHAQTTCQDCHAGASHFSTDTACGDCHEQTHGGTQAPCVSCHIVAAFEPAFFDHGDRSLPDGHQAVGCLGCHQDFQFADTPKDCQGCHAADLPHEPLGECSQCHSTTGWDQTKVFQHNVNTTFALTGRHLQTDCAGCHEAGAAFDEAPSDCAGCHRAAALPVHGDLAQVGDCSSCHATSGFEVSTFDHGASGFPLRGKHQALACFECHADFVADGEHSADAAGGLSTGPSHSLHDTQRWSQRIDLRKVRHGVALGADGVHRGSRVHGLGSFSPHPFWASVAFAVVEPTSKSSGSLRTCHDCHDDPHGDTVSDTCSDCHTESGFTPSTFGVEAHGKTAFPLSGKHLDLDCRDCHQEISLTDVPTQCGGCHLDAHAGKLGSECQDCHTTTHFEEVPDFDHAATGFTVHGVHGELACEDCHAGEVGVALANTESASTCSVCHVAPHNDTLGDDCLSCHSDEAGNTFEAAHSMAFEHDFTGFPLTRRHVGLNCTQCHAAGTKTQTGECANCHLDPHSGGMSPECELCHRPDRWRLSRFDHDLAGWPLRGKHHSTPCASCHVNQRWVGVPTDCFECHALDAGRANALRGDHPFGLFDCTDCHVSQVTWRLVR